VKSAEIGEALQRVFDPELGIDIVSLGLVYDIQTVGEDAIEVAITTTSQSCPMGPALFDMAETVLQYRYPDATVRIRPVFDPPWDVSMMTAPARRQLGLPEQVPVSR